MANYNIKTTGVRTTGASTVDDWTDANCYNESNAHAIVEAEGDTFVIDAGVYTLAGEWSHTFATTISIRDNGPVTLQRTSGANVLTINPNNTTKSTVMGTVNNKLVISGSNITTAALNFPNRANAVDIDIDHVEIAGSDGIYGTVLSHRTGTISLKNMKYSGTFAQQVVESTPSLADTGDFTLITENIEYDCNTLLNGLFSGMRLEKANAANICTLQTKHHYGTISCAGAGSLSSAYGILVSGFDSVLIENCDDFTTQGDSSSTVAGSVITVRGLDAVNRQTVDPIVRNNKNLKFYQRAGDTIGIGTDTTIGFLVNPTTYGNTFEGQESTADSPHGLVFRGLPSGLGYANHGKRFHSPFMLSLCTSDDVQMFGNLTTDTYGKLGASHGVCLSLKGNSGGQMHNNTCVITPNSIDGIISNYVYGIWAREQAAVPNSASKTYNNNILFLGMAPRVNLVKVDALDANTFSNDNYYSDQTLPANPWHYAGVDYASLAAWNAAQETNDATDKANFSGTVAEIVAAFGDLDIDKLVATTNTYGGGLKWWTGANPETLGEPLPDLDIDQGIQSTNSPLHPRRL